MEFGNSWMPDLNKPGMRDGDKLRAINEYLIDFEKKVRHALSNIDEENLSEAFAGTLKKTDARLTGLEENKGLIHRAEGKIGRFSAAIFVPCLTAQSKSAENHFLLSSKETEGRYPEVTEVFG